MIRRILAVSLPLLFLAASAQSVPVFSAGWDFAEYIGPSAPSIDSINPVTTLDALYSDFDLTSGAGQESRQFGTAFLDGTNGSTAGAGTGPINCFQSFCCTALSSAMALASHSLRNASRARLTSG